MDIPQIDVDAAAELQQSGAALFLDVRDPASYAAARVPGAVHASDATIAGFLAATDRARKVVVYCYHGHSSLGGAAYLRSEGFTDVASMKGGFAAWSGRHPHESG
ncbi:MAG: thiosulfate sulfurtransferase [Planctomycetes bacterium]|nr:thiosulfate sulfurtransferase [Planctomycetota bacterium]